MRDILTWILSISCLRSHTSASAMADSRRAASSSSFTCVESVRERGREKSEYASQSSTCPRDASGVGKEGRGVRAGPRRRTSSRSSSRTSSGVIALLSDPSLSSTSMLARSTALGKGQVLAKKDVIFSSSSLCPLPGAAPRAPFGPWCDRPVPFLARLRLPGLARVPQSVALSLGLVRFHGRKALFPSFPRPEKPARYLYAVRTGFFYVSRR